MLAGRMKLKNFLMLALLPIGAFVALSWYVFHDPSDGPPRPPPVAIRTAPPPPPDPPRSDPPPSEPPVVEAPPTAAAGGARPVDQVVLRFVGRDLKSDKVKDATKGHPFKVNLYQDPGEATTNRAKIDLDRDDKWDEKWTFKGQEVLREVAPQDDEHYTESYVWTGSGWGRR